MGVSAMEFIPTYLYIKQHTITGKLYFGKTIKNPEKYLGSGSRWKNHIKKHGKEHVVNLWFHLFDDLFELVSFAISFSNKMDIVESDSWLNMIPEFGIDSPRGHGMLGKSHSDETKLKMSINNAWLGVPKTEEQKLNLSLKMKGRGHTQTDETKAKISKANKGRVGWKPNEDQRNKISERMSGENHPLYGKSFSEESKQKMSESRKSYLRLKYLDKSIFKRYNITQPNGITFNNLTLDMICGLFGFHKGRLKDNKNRNKGWYKGFFIEPVK